MSKIVIAEGPGGAGPEILVEFTYEDIRKIVISRAIHNAEAEGHSIDFNDVSFFNFSWAPGMSARVRLNLAPQAPVVGAGDRQGLPAAPALAPQ